MILDNAEFTRLRRSKLRPQKMIILAGIGAFICGGILALQYLGETQFGRFPVPDLRGMLHTYFFWCTGLEMGAVILYGGMLAAQTVVMERERSTLDFQRLTGGGPWKLALGKLFGAPLEAYCVGAVCMLFSGLSVMSGAVTSSTFIQAHAIIMVYGLMCSAIGLLCSAIVEKTSNAGGLAMLIGLGISVFDSALSTGTNVVSAINPVRYLVALNEGGVATNGYYSMYSDVFGHPVHIFFVFCFVNLCIAALCFMASVRRIANDEFSFMSFRQAVFAFVVTEVLMISAFFSSVSRDQGLAIFHVGNLAMLLTFVFGLTPSGELVRGRLHRAKPNQHWRVMFELQNRLQDAPAMASILLFSGAYAMFGVALTMLGAATVQEYAAVVVVAGSGVAMAAALLYIHAYFESGSFRMALFLMIGALSLPPLIVSTLVSGYHCVLVSPIAYLVTLDRLDQLYKQGLNPMGAVWSCPLACLALGSLGFVLVAMRVRYLLDTNESQRKRDEEAQLKADKNVPAETAAARLLAKQ